MMINGIIRRRNSEVIGRPCSHAEFACVNPPSALISFPPSSSSSLSILTAVISRSSIGTTVSVSPPQLQPTSLHLS